MTRMPTGRHRARMEIRSQATCVSCWQTVYICPGPDTLWEAEFKSNELSNLTEEISRQHSIQYMPWLLLASFNQIYSGN